MNRIFPLLVVLVIGLTVAPTTAVAAQDPRFETYVAEPTLPPGQTVQVGVQLVNDAEDTDDQVDTARNVKAEMRSGSTPFDVKSGTKLLGEMPDGRAVSTAFTVEVPENIEPGTYRIPIRLSYEFETDESESTTVYATVRIEDRAYFKLASTTSSVPVGDSGTVDISLTNVGSKAANNATITTSSSSADIRFGQGNAASEFVENWEPGETRTVSFDVQATNEAEPRTYTLTTQVEYEDANGNAKQSFPVDSGLALLPAQTFAFDGIQSTLRVGEQGTLKATVRNEGPRPVSDAVVTLGKTSQTVQPQETEFGIGTLDVGETAEVTFPIAIAESAEPSQRRLPFTVSYRNANGDLQQTDEIYVSAPVAAERDRFVFSQERSTLRVGREGTLELAVQNNGEAVSDVVVTILQPGQNIHPQETEYAIGSMEAGSSQSIAFPIEISDNAEAVPRQLSFTVSYEDSEGDSQETRPYDLRVDIGERQDRFGVEPVDATMTAGGGGTIAVSVTNNGEEPVENINAKIFADDPLSTSDDEAFIDALEPGASETVTFSIGVAGSALQKKYPLSMDLQYEEGGETKLSDTYQVPVTVQAAEGSGIPVTLIVGIVVVGLLAAAGFVWYRRR